MVHGLDGRLGLLGGRVTRVPAAGGAGRAREEAEKDRESEKGRRWRGRAHARKEDHAQVRGRRGRLLGGALRGAAALALGAGSSAGGGALPLIRKNCSAVSSSKGDAATEAAVRGRQVAGIGGAGTHALDAGMVLANLLPNPRRDHVEAAVSIGGDSVGLVLGARGNRGSRGLAGLTAARLDSRGGILSCACTTTTRSRVTIYCKNRRDARQTSKIEFVKLVLFRLRPWFAQEGARAVFCVLWSRGKLTPQKKQNYKLDLHDKKPDRQVIPLREVFFPEGFEFWTT